MMNIICWTIIAVFGLLYLISLIGTLISIKDENKNSYLLLGCLFCVLICIFPIKEIYSPFIALRVWQICFLIELFASFLAIFLSKEDRFHAIIVFVISLPLIVLPFYNSFELSNSSIPINLASDKISINVESSLSIIGIVTALILIVCTIITTKRINTLKSGSRLSSLLQQNISALSREDSFRRPMDTLWSYEANSKLRQLDVKMQQCIAEIQKLSQKPFLPSSIYSASLDELRPMIYSMSAEISKLNSLVSKKDIPNSLPSEFTILTELNHTLATPLSQIEVNCELLKSKVKSGSQPQIDKIVQYVNFCRSTIVAYKELLSSSTTGDSSNYTKALMNCFDMYCSKCNKTGLKMILDADEDIHISKNILLSVISPLLENAVTASPVNSEIKVNVSNTGSTINITLENDCEEVPLLSNLQKVGYSSKKDHIGTGLETVRHFLTLLSGNELNISLDNKTIKFSLQFPSK